MPAPAHDLIVKLFTLIRTAEIYPPGNATLIRVREAFLENVRSLLEQEESSYVEIDRHHNHFVINKKLVKPEIAALTTFTKLLYLFDRLKIHRLEISSSVDEEVLDLFIPLIIHDRRSPEGEQQLPQFSSSAIRVFQGDSANTGASFGVQAEHFTDVLAKMIVFHRQTLTDLVAGKQIDSILTRRMVQELIDTLRILDTRALLTLPAFVNDPQLSSHAACHSILTILFARSLGMNPVTVQDLAIASLFSQIGRALIPSSILTKRGDLTEEDRKVLDSIPLKSLQVLLKLKNLSPTGALRLITAYEIGQPEKPEHPYVKIVEVIGDYEAMTSHRTYRTALHPREALATLINERDKKYDRATVNSFVQFMGPWPPGSTGMIDGKPAVVLNPDFSALFEDGRWRKVREIPEEMIPIHRFPVNPASAFSGLASQPDTKS